jgi:hypothetical protein
MTTKHDMVLCGKLYPAGTLVEVLSWDDPLVLAVFPDMKKISISKFVAVKFPDRDHATIGLSKSFTHYGERFTSAKSRK